jgi:hypothetical protein
LADVVGKLFGSLGPLDELTVRGCDLQIFIAPFIDPSESGYAFPQVKEFTVSDIWRFDLDEGNMDGIVELAKLQHELGKSFEHVRVRARTNPSMTIGRRLRPWVSTADCYDL